MTIDDDDDFIRQQNEVNGHLNKIHEIILVNLMISHKPKFNNRKK